MTLDEMIKQRIEEVIKEVASRGGGQAEVAKILGRSHHWVSWWLKKNGVNWKMLKFDAQSGGEQLTLNQWKYRRTPLPEVGDGAAPNLSVGTILAAAQRLKDGET